MRDSNRMLSVGDILEFYTKEPSYRKYNGCICKISLVRYVTSKGEMTTRYKPHSTVNECSVVVVKGNEKYSKGKVICAVMPHELRRV